MAIENRLRQRLDLQSTRRQQLEFKEMKRQAEREEEDEFRRKVFYTKCCLRLDAFYSTDRTDFLRGIVLIPPLFADTKNVSLLDAREIRRRWPNWTNERSEETNEAIGTQESSRKTDWGQENSVPEGKG